MTFTSTPNHLVCYHNIVSLETELSPRQVKVKNELNLEHQKFVPGVTSGLWILYYSTDQL
jgi:hypothetical protein